MYETSDSTCTSADGTHHEFFFTLYISFLITIMSHTCTLLSKPTGTNAVFKHFSLNFFNYVMCHCQKSKKAFKLPSFNGHCTSSIDTFKSMQ